MDHFCGLAIQFRYIGAVTKLPRVFLPYAPRFGVTIGIAFITKLSMTWMKSQKYVPVPLQNAPITKLPRAFAPYEKQKSTILRTSTDSYRINFITKLPRVFAPCEKQKSTEIRISAASVFGTVSEATQIVMGHCHHETQHNGCVFSPAGEPKLTQYCYNKMRPQAARKNFVISQI